MANFFAQNLKSLRKKHQLTQTDFALKIGTNRPKIGSYEEGRAEPNLETLQNVAHYFKIKLDDLLEKDLDQDTPEQSKDIEGKKLRILPILVNQAKEEKITLVPIKAAAGYLNGYSDPDYIEKLPAFDLPFSELPQRTHRAFQIQGDSMLPITSGSYILGEYVENWRWIKDGQCYIVVSKDQGVVYKRLFNKLEQEQILELHSDNEIYEPFTLPAEDIIEVWKASGFISFQLPDAGIPYASVGHLSDMVLKLKQEVEKLKEKS